MKHFDAIGTSKEYLIKVYQHLLMFPISSKLQNSRILGITQLQGLTLVPLLGLKSHSNFKSLSSQVSGLTQLEDLRSQLSLKASDLTVISTVSSLGYNVFACNFRVSDYGSRVSSKFKCVRYHSLVCRTKISYNLVIL